MDCSRNKFLPYSVMSIPSLHKLVGAPGMNLRRFGIKAAEASWLLARRLEDELLPKRASVGFAMSLGPESAK